MGGGGWPNRHITFIVAKKSLIYGLFYSLFGICGGKVLFENVVWGWERGWLKTSEYHHVGEGV